MPEGQPGIRVLVADDDYVIATTLSQILRLNGYDTATVSSGEGAIASALMRRPDVLISDVVMGGISGIEAAARIVEINPACVVILISGQAHTADLQPRNRDGRGSFEILLKPVHPAALLERIAASISTGRTAGIPVAQRAATAC